MKVHPCTFFRFFCIIKEGGITMSKNRDVRRVALVGTGFVGMSFAYALINQGAADELVLIDINQEKSIGEAMDLNHGTSFGPSITKVFAGTYDDCEYVDVVVITAGAPQLPGETRLDLAAKNAKIIKDITLKIKASGFHGMIVVASNPVDLMTYVVAEVSGLPKNQVIGSGTTLDTSRLRYLLGSHIGISSKNIHAYILGEHGDSSFVPWSNAYIGTKALIPYLQERHIYKQEVLDDIYVQVRDAAYKIIEAKKATYYAIGMALVRIVKAIFEDEASVLTLSVYLNGHYHVEDLYIGVPAVLTRHGVKEIIQLDLTIEEQKQFEASVNKLKDVLETTIKPILR